MLYTLPQSLCALLLAARTAEKTAVGSNRRSAFRNTRVIIGALHAMGYPTQLIAEELGITPDSARDRAEVDGRLWLGDVADLTGLEEATIRAYIEKYGMHLDPTTQTLGAIEVLRALVTESATNSEQAVGA